MFHVERAAEVAVLRMEQGKVNAIDIELAMALELELAHLATDAEVRALVLIGSGSVFSAGVDLLRLVDAGPDYVRGFLPRLQTAFEELASFPKPLVAAINGHAIAGGCVMAAAADMRIMAAGGGRIGVPEILVGVPFPRIALEIMRAAVRPDRFQELILTGVTLDPQAALDWGLVDRVVEPGELETQAQALARELARHPPEVIAITKAQLRSELASRVALETGDEHERIARVWTDPDTHVRIRDFVERTFKRD